MKCPNCGSSELAVQDSRSADEEVKRRRVCTSCAQRYVTVEKIVDVYIPARPGPKAELVERPKKAPAKTKRGKEVLKARTTARRRFEDLADEASVYDDLHDVRDVWQR